jgi:spore coat polysaccharide biosynthesis protein SpsF (cytidylyltransferase family)
VDTNDDLAFVKSIYKQFESEEMNFTFEDVLKYFKENPNLNRIVSR